MNNIPPNWSWVRLGDVAQSEKGKKPKNLSKQKDGKNSIPYINIKAFEKRGIDNFTDGENCRFCEPDDVLVVWDGARCGLVGRGIKGAIGSTLAKIKSTSHTDSFLFYFLQQFYKLINSSPKGVGIPHIEPNLFWGLDIPLPPLPEQKKIVKKIEKLFTELDSGVASLKKTKEQIKLYRQSVLAAAFSGRLGTNSIGRDKSRLVPTDEQTGNEHLPYKQGAKIAAEPKITYKDNGLPRSWKWVKLGEVSNKIQYGFTESATTEPIGPKFLRITDIQNGNVLWNEVPFCKIPDDIKYKYLLNEGDIVFARTGATVGKSFLITGQIPESIYASYLIRIQLSDEVNKKFVYFFFQSNKYWHQISEGQVGIGQPNVNGTKLSKLIIPICSLSQQTQIVEEIEKRFSEVDKIEKVIDESLKKSETLRQSILKKAFEGRLV